MSLTPWGSAGWLGINDLAVNQPGWETTGFDDSAWSEVQLPLGGGSPAQDGGTTFCPIHAAYPPNTNWPSNSEFLLRRWFTGDDFTVSFTVDNHAWIYWDGVLIAEGDNEDASPSCPERDDHTPAGGSLGQGTHLLAIRCQDRGEETYFDCEVSITGLTRSPSLGRIGFGVR